MTAAPAPAPAPAAAFTPRGDSLRWYIVQVGRYHFWGFSSTGKIASHISHGGFIFYFQNTQSWFIDFALKICKAWVRSVVINKISIITKPSYWLRLARVPGWGMYLLPSPPTPEMGGAPGQEWSLAGEQIKQWDVTSWVQSGPVMPSIYSVSTLYLLCIHSVSTASLRISR